MLETDADYRHRQVDDADDRRRQDDDRDGTDADGHGEPAGDRP